MTKRKLSAVRVRRKRNVFYLVAAVVLLTCVLDTQFASARYSINSGQSCSSRGQIRDFQAQRFICLKVNSKGGSSSGPSLVWVKISSPKSTPKSTTTIVKKTCQDGGTCKVGDRGPGGGLIFYVKADPSSPWEYLELAPTYYDSTLISGLSWHQAPAAADVYKTQTRDDWFLPTYDQLVLAILELWYLPNFTYDHPIFIDCWKSISVCPTLWTSTSLQPGLGLHIGPRFEPNSTSLNLRKSNPQWRTESALTSRLLPVIAIRGVKSNLVSTPVSTSASVTTTSSTSLTKTKLLSASYEVLDATRIRITWNFIASVREYRICVGDLCSRSNPQWLTIGPTENSKVLDLPLGQSQNYWVHALLLNDAKEYDSIDTRPCCIGTKWADGVTVSAKNNFSP